MRQRLSYLYLNQWRLEYYYTVLAKRKLKRESRRAAAFYLRIRHTASVSIASVHVRITFSTFQLRAAVGVRAKIRKFYCAIFYEVLKIGKRKLHFVTSFQATDHYFVYLGTVFFPLVRAKMPDKCVVFGRNNRPKTEERISLRQIPFDGSDNTRKRERKNRWIDNAKLMLAQREAT